MASRTSIEWTDSTWNPVRGCSRASDGCRNCYASSMAARFDRPGKPFQGLSRKTNSGTDWSGEVRFIEEHLLDPLRRETPTMFFVNSVSDLFHEKLAVDKIVSVAKVMEACRWHTFQVLTKRASRMATLLNNELRFGEARLRAKLCDGRHRPSAQCRARCASGAKLVSTLESGKKTRAFVVGWPVAILASLDKR